MKTQDKIVYFGEKGQITLPVAWRMRVGTNAIRISPGNGDRLEIIPVATREDEETGWVTVFNKDRDNNGKGILASDFLKVLQNIRKKEDSKKNRK